ncbi:hypothetical protein AQI88_13040 [Streptomyces cellostaticus]|uniref:Uncharacterized protein n=1 Tax=Streptomyces cellostaticus TaxID=67285 RepID=A0A101NNE4_9ACTN|nr:hypothetical protein [Streptomyces cellostaticus]KUM96207.1 hypothetical protein AQI88_13040 [Streptomyces cellostaticus]GHI09175.1 hypothetical protein Scel_74960 [Streptomyces cellostaticus]
MADLRPLREGPLDTATTIALTLFVPARGGGPTSHLLCAGDLYGPGCPRELPHRQHGPERPAADTPSDDDRTSKG